MEATPATAGLLSTKIKEWLLRMRYAFVGANLPALDRAVKDRDHIERNRKLAMTGWTKTLDELEALTYVHRHLEESVEELQSFKDDVADWKHEVLTKAYDIIDNAAHYNNSKWVSEAMRHIILTEQFLTDEKRAFTEKCIRSMPFDDFSPSSGDVRLDKHVQRVKSVHYMNDELSFEFLRQILYSLPENLSVTQRVQEGFGEADTIMTVSVKPKQWHMRIDPHLMDQWRGVEEMGLTSNQNTYKMPK